MLIMSNESTQSWLVDVELFLSRLWITPPTRVSNYSHVRRRLYAWDVRRRSLVRSRRRIRGLFAKSLSDVGEAWLKNTHTECNWILKLAGAS